MKGRALLFGLNYPSSPSALRGCVNDVMDMAAFLSAKLKINATVLTDVDPKTKMHTTALGIMRNLSLLAMQTYSENLDFVWIHYSGHGSSIIDRTSDEGDGFDECLVPTDYLRSGVLTDDVINKLLCNINPKTRVVFVCDACHSGTMCDVKFSWESALKYKVENAACAARAKILSLSGCLDNQTSADAVGISGTGRFSGALTTCLLKVLSENVLASKDAFLLLKLVTEKLKLYGFEQRPELCSTYNLITDKIVF